MKKYDPHIDDTQRVKLLKRVAQLNHDELMTMKSQGINIDNNDKFLKMLFVISSLNRRIHRRKGNHSIQQLELYAEPGTDSGSPSNTKSGGDHSGWSLLREGWRQFREMFIFGNGDKAKQKLYSGSFQNDDRSEVVVREKKSTI